MRAEVKEMEEGNKTPASKRNAPGTGEQYLRALLKCADWVSAPYKQLAEKNRENPEVLKELYLCACDGVPIEAATEAQGKNPPQGALRFLRLKHLETTALGNYSKELSGIKKTTSTLERDVRMMSDMLTHIASHVPSFDAMFPEEQPLQEEGEEIEKPPAQGQHVEEERMPDPDAESPSVVKQQETRGNMQETEKKGNILGSGLQKMKAWKKGNRKKRKHIPDFVEELLEDGYSSEQLGYILDCMEDGADPEEIKRFASPKLPVELMRRLRMMEKKEETGNGK